jgi:predicted Rdx family selenoprotein
LAAKIKEALNVDAELIESSGGVYDITVDDQLVYSKHDNDNQFPETDESVVALIQAV